MTIDEVTKLFGSMYKACRAIGIKPQNSTRWRQIGYIPWKQQCRFAHITEGVLMPDDKDPASGKDYSIPETDMEVDEKK